MTTTAFYRVGQAAKLLGISSHHVRRLCEAGLVQAEVSDGGQWRLPVDEVVRLKAQGVPPVPSVDVSAGTLHDSKTSKSSEHKGSHESESLAVWEERASVEVAAARLQRRKIELEQEQVEDVFRDREAARTSEAQRLCVEQDRRRAEARRIEWRSGWLKFAQDRMPCGAPPDVRLRVNDAVAAALDNKLSINDSKEVVSRLVDATVAISLEPYHRERRKREIIDRAVRALPPDLYHGLYYNEAAMDDAKRIARQGMEALGVVATDAQLKAAAASALQPLIVEFQHDRSKRRVIDGLQYWRWCVRNPPAKDERAAATEAVTRALDACQPGTPAATMEKIKDQTLALFDKQIEERVSNELKQSEAEREADRALLHVTTYVGNEYEFESFTERMDDEKRLEDSLRPILICKFLRGEFQEAKAAHRFIQQYIDEHISVEER
jgi:excisionase family DNA binding protein